MRTSSPKCSNDIPMKSLLTQQPVICVNCNAALRVTPRSSLVLAVLSFAIGTLIYSMLHDAGLVQWLRYLYGFGATALCIILLRPLVLRLRKLEPESRSLQLETRRRYK